MDHRASIQGYADSTKRDAKKAFQFASAIYREARLALGRKV